VLRETAAPAVLHELAFITNATDAQKLASPTERQKAAEAHLRAIQRHYNIPPYVPTGGNNPPPQDEAGEIVGHVYDDQGLIVGATVKLDGGATVATDEHGAFTFTETPPGVHMLSASAEGHASKTFDVTVASAARAEVEIMLERAEGPPGGDEDPKGLNSSCAAGVDHGLLLLLALLALRRRRT
jgi:hypothetical protein